MNINLMTVRPDGSGYCVVEREDGSTFGQEFYNLPVNDKVAFSSALLALIDRATPDDVPAPVVVKDVVDMVGVSLDVATLKAEVKAATAVAVEPVQGEVVKP